MGNAIEASLNGGTTHSVHGTGTIPYGLCNRTGGRTNRPITLSFATAGSRLHRLVCAPRVCAIGLGVSNGRYGTVLGRVRFRPMGSGILRISFCRVARGGPVIVRMPVGLGNLTRNIGTNNHLTTSMHGLGIETACTGVPRHLSVSIAGLTLNGAVGINRLDCRNLRLIADGSIIIYRIGVAHNTETTTTGTRGWFYA